MTVRPTTTALLSAGVHDVIDGDLVRPVFQPIVDLVTGQVAGYEALARGLPGSVLESPAALFAAARAVGRQVELDWVCRAAAYRAALDARLPSSIPLFVNCEPSSLRAECPPRLQRVLERSRERLWVVEELTERAVAADPYALLAATAAARRQGRAIAMDDVGVDPASLALLPFVDPDVVKLDMSLVQSPPDREVARVVHAVQAHSERTGAVILAEGIEENRHVENGRLFGARLGQGWHFGRPGALPRDRIAPLRDGLLHDLVHRRRAEISPEPRTPFEIGAAARQPTRATKAQLLPTSILLEERAVDGAQPPVLLSCFQDVEHLTARTRERYARIAAVSPFVAALGRGLPVDPVPGVRGADLGAEDPLRGEWNVIVVGPHFAGALLAREVPGRAGSDMERSFDMVLTHDRDLVLAAARSLMRWVAPVRPLDS